jgi:UDP-glucose 4-epimerase
MRILFTGISSFTGFWFARTLAAKGHEIVGTLSGSSARYEGVRARRIEQLKSLCRLVPDLPFGSDAFLRFVAGEGPWDLLCHHAANVTNYKSPEFDIHHAVQANTLNLRQVLSTLKRASLKAVILTGTFFENDEGLGSQPLRAFSPYGLSKGLTWQVFRYYCRQAEVPLAKFVIPNPFGPFEEERFTAYLLRAWRSKKAAAVNTPDYVRDNMPVDLLAEVYVRFADQVLARLTPESRINPSAYVESQGAFALRVAREVRQRLGWACELDLARQTDFTEPFMRVNFEPAFRLVPEWSETAFWDSFTAFYEKSLAH